MHQETQVEQMYDESRLQAIKEELKAELLGARAGGRCPDRSGLDSRTRETLKEEILAELKRQAEMPDYGSVARGRQRTSRRELQRLKNELLAELRQELRENREWEEYEDYESRRPYPWRPDGVDRRLLNYLRDELQAEVQAQRIYQEHYQRHPNRPPYARELVQDLLEESQELGCTPTELLRALKQLQNRGTLRYRLSQLLNSREGVGFKWGLSASLLALFLLPSLTRSMRPLAKWVARETMELTEKAQRVAENIREEFEDILAEAQFDRARQTIDADLAGGSDGAGTVNTEDGQK
ncbi:MAG: hypothetical protein ACUVTU_01735 [Desulfurispora sp.]|uniref:hypothetical protein n=1 Tax=Desulfurispora sp. TaxID=3014275 RepID=UPI0040499BCD